jgi:CheY-like chemotaxis protein
VYDLILMDVQMPGIDGLEATQRIRRMSNGHQVPILAVTASAFTEDRERCLEAGMNDFLTKPIDPEALYTAMHAWLSKGLPASEAIHSDRSNSARPR